MSLLACWFALVPHGQQQHHRVCHTQTHKLIMKPMGLLQEEGAQSSLCVWAQVSVHMNPRVDVLMLMFNFMLLRFFFVLAVDSLLVKARKQSQLAFESKEKLEKDAD